MLFFNIVTLQFFWLFFSSASHGFTASNRFSSIIALYLAPSIFSSTPNSPTVASEENSPLRMMLRSPIYPAGTERWVWSFFLFRHTQLLASNQNIFYHRVWQTANRTSDRFPSTVIETKARFVERTTNNYSADRFSHLTFRIFPSSPKMLINARLAQPVSLGGRPRFVALLLFLFGFPGDGLNRNLFRAQTSPKTFLRNLPDVFLDLHEAIGVLKQNLFLEQLCW